MFLLKPIPKSKPDTQNPRRRRCLVVVSRTLWLMRVLADHKGEPGDLGKTLVGTIRGVQLWVASSRPPASLTRSNFTSTDFPFWLLRRQKTETVSASSSTVIVRLGRPGLS